MEQTKTHPVVQKLKKFRYDTGLSGMEIAKRMGVSYTCIYYLLDGTTQTPSYRTQRKITKFLKLQKLKDIAQEPIIKRKKKKSCLAEKKAPSKTLFQRVLTLMTLFK